MHSFHLSGCGGLVVRSRPQGRKVPGSKPDSTEEPPRKRVWCTLNPSRPFGERRATAQVSSSSSDRGSKVRGPSQNSPRVASKPDVVVTKLSSHLSDLNIY
ncbi:hypothetical protein AVEN_185725-1 [Araneus ventricosus]|uniref:Uncharacterized protein n=1 Tax=Araneus ventricosus TaxID=182803 RepID=A0A4Y2I2M0_ARAVE|nr:hypothetical protein AVEN_185725-1 [Araneus ventricosus]